MSPIALQSMVKSIQKRLVDSRDAHRDERNDDLGEVVELSLSDDKYLIYKAKVDLNLSGAKNLWYRITGRGKNCDISIGGSIGKARMESVAEVGRKFFCCFVLDLMKSRSLGEPLPNTASPMPL